MNRHALPIVVLVVATGLAQDKPIATVDGTPILESELDIKAQLVQIEQQAYQVRVRAVEALVDRKLLAKAAAAKNLTVEKFVKQEVDDKIPEPSVQEVEGYYWGQKERSQRPFEQVKDQLTRNLRAAKVADARQKLMRSLRENSKVAILLEPPRTNVEVGNAPRMGPASAPVTIVEFSDFQCPFCRRVVPTLKELRAKYGDKISLVFKDLPLAMHPEAPRAAQAARCAGDQNKYWEYHDALFETASLAANVYPELAKKVGLEEAQFKGCLDSGKHKAGVQADAQQARGLGIEGTPAFYINGVFVNGAQPLEAFTQIIDRELAMRGLKAGG
jgi:protein-disulfide isomerase